ncbi:MAG: sigma factor-like helix-turn-helix DNA-binding protein [Minisyncoccia bacterium]
MITFKPKLVTKKLLTVLPSRARDVLEKRYGLGANSLTHTLESIGKSYGITRERVRQIENYGIQAIQKSEVYKEFQDSFQELQDAFQSLGGVISEQDLFNELSKDASLRNHIYFILVVGDPFKRIKEDNSFNYRWYVEKKISDTVEKALKNIFESLGEDDLISEDEILARLKDELGEIEEKYRDEKILKRWLSISKQIDKNPLGEWGPSTSPNVRAKGIRDYAYLAVKRHGSPMHFKEVAQSIKDLFSKKAHIATTHNELIKDKRFILVGRGLYALSEWGYSAGVVKDVLRDILNTHGPLTRDEIIDKVRKERYVKDNTIIVNLQDTALFKKLADGNYMLVE